METFIFPGWPGIFKETRVLPTLLLAGITYLTGDLLLREPPLGMQAAKSQSRPQRCYAVPTPPRHSGSLHIFEERLLQMCLSAKRGFAVNIQSSRFFFGFFVPTVKAAARHRKGNTPKLVCVVLERLELCRGWMVESP